MLIEINPYSTSSRPTNKQQTKVGLEEISKARMFNMKYHYLNYIYHTKIGLI